MRCWPGVRTAWGRTTWSENPVTAEPVAQVKRRGPAVPRGKLVCTKPGFREAYMRTAPENPPSIQNVPGWRGRGVPSVRTLLGDWPRNFLRVLRLRGRKAARNLTLAVLADLWTFHVRSLGTARSRVTCPCCGWSGPGFAATWNSRAVTFNSRCPSCDSRSRHRGLHALLPRICRDLAPGRILVFAPERVVLVLLHRLGRGGSVVTTDLHCEDVDFPGEDIQRLSFPDESFCLLVCNHVLEHVADDTAALRECARILTPGGVAVFSVPGDFSRFDTVEYPGPDDSGHWRHYGRDVADKMASVFGHVEIVELASLSEPHWGVRRGDVAFVCRRAILSAKSHERLALA